MTNDNNDQDYLDILKMLETDDTISNDRNVTYDQKPKEEKKSKVANVAPLLATVAPIRNENIMSTSTSGITNATCSKLQTDMHKMRSNKPDESNYGSGTMPLVSNILLPNGLPQQLQYAPQQFLGTSGNGPGNIVCLMAPQLQQQPQPVPQPESSPYQFVLSRGVMFSVTNASHAPTPPPIQSTAIISSTADANKISLSSANSSVCSSLPKLLPKPQPNSRHLQVFQATTLGAPNLISSVQQTNHFQQMNTRRPAINRKSTTNVRQRNNGNVNNSGGYKANKGKYKQDNSSAKGLLVTSSATTPSNTPPVQTTIPLNNNFIQAPSGINVTTNSISNNTNIPVTVSSANTNCSVSSVSHDNIFLAWENAEQSDEIAEEYPTESHPITPNQPVISAPSTPKSLKYYMAQIQTIVDYENSINFDIKPPKFKRASIENICPLIQSYTISNPLCHNKCPILSQQKPEPIVSNDAATDSIISHPSVSLAGNETDVKSQVMQFIYSQLRSSNNTLPPIWKYFNSFYPQPAPITSTNPLHNVTTITSTNPVSMGPIVPIPDQSNTLSICTVPIVTEDDEDLLEDEDEISPALTSTRANPTRLAKLDLLLQTGCNPPISSNNDSNASDNDVTYDNQSPPNVDLNEHNQSVQPTSSTPPYSIPTDEQMTFTQYTTSSQCWLKKSTSNKWNTCFGGTQIKPTRVLEPQSDETYYSHSPYHENSARKKSNFDTLNHNTSSSSILTKDNDYKRKKRLKKYRQRMKKIKKELQAYKGKENIETEEVENVSENNNSVITSSNAANWMISDSGKDANTGSLKIKLKLNLGGTGNNSTASKQHTPLPSPLAELSSSMEEDAIVKITQKQPSIPTVVIPRIPTPEPEVKNNSQQRSNNLKKKRVRNTLKVDAKKRRKTSVTRKKPAIVLQHKPVAPTIVTKNISSDNTNIGNKEDEDKPSPMKKIFFTRKEDRRSSAAALTIDVGNCSTILNIPSITSSYGGGPGGLSSGPNTSISNQSTMSKKSSFMNKTKKSRKKSNSTIKKPAVKKSPALVPTPPRVIHTPQPATSLPSPSPTPKQPPIILKLKPPKPPLVPIVQPQLSPLPPPTPPQPDLVLPPPPPTTVFPGVYSGSMKVRIKRTQDTGDPQVVVPPNNNPATTTTSQFDFDESTTTILAPPPITHQTSTKTRPLSFSPASSDEESTDNDQQHETICRKLLSTQDNNQHNSINSLHDDKPTQYLVGSSPTVFIDENKVDLIILKNSSYKKMTTNTNTPNNPNTNNPNPNNTNSVEVFLPGCFMQNESPSMPVLAPQEPLQIKLDSGSNNRQQTATVMNESTNQQHTYSHREQSSQQLDYSQHSYYSSGSAGQQQKQQTGVGNNGSSGSIEDLFNGNGNQNMAGNVGGPGSNSYMTSGGGGGSVTGPPSYPDSNTLTNQHHHSHSQQQPYQQHHPNPHSQSTSSGNNNNSSHNGNKSTHKRYSNDSSTGNNNNTNTSKSKRQSDTNNLSNTPSNMSSSNNSGKKSQQQQPTNSSVAGILSVTSPNQNSANNSNSIGASSLLSNSLSSTNNTAATSGFLSQAASLSNSINPYAMTSHPSANNSSGIPPSHDIYNTTANLYNQEYYNHIIGDYLYNSVPNHWGTAMMQYCKTLQQQQQSGSSTGVVDGVGIVGSGASMSSSMVAAGLSNLGALQHAAAQQHQQQQQPGVAGGLLGNPADYNNPAYPYGMSQSSYIYSGFGLPK